MAETIKELRKGRSMSQKEMAWKLGVHWSTLKRWENEGGIPVGRVITLATVLGVKPEKILLAIGEMEAVDGQLLRRI